MSRPSETSVHLYEHLRVWHRSHPLPVDMFDSWNIPDSEDGWMLESVSEDIARSIKMRAREKSDLAHFVAQFRE